MLNTCNGVFIFKPLPLKFDIKLSTNGIHLHLINKIACTLKIAKPLFTKRNDESTLQKRVDFASSNINYDSNCIFVDESGNLPDPRREKQQR
ncbi:hypothetical protein BD408DRAFT_193335 [Parasitella parasitica]|nr:hypothetical protein BD408DRAFT_193335 [Parasitella parasitica]